MTTADIVIIGSGVAGTAVAARILAGNPSASVLMLEAGSKVKMRDFSLHQEYLISGRLPYQFCEDAPYPTKDNAGENESWGKTVLPMSGSRLMVYGGSTVHWGGWSFRLKPEDFRLGSALQAAPGHAQATRPSQDPVMSQQPFELLEAFKGDRRLLPDPE